MSPVHAAARAHLRDFGAVPSLIVLSGPDLLPYWSLNVPCESLEPVAIAAVLKGHEWAHFRENKHERLRLPFRRGQAT